MASGPHTFAVLSVFSPEKFRGNPLAVVAVRGNSLTQQRKSLIAKEFGYSETIFMHDAPGPGMPRRIDIFTEKGEEIPFAGHPLIGATHYLFKFCEPALYSGPNDRNTQYTSTFMTKAGPVPVVYNSYRQVAACSVPHDVHLHHATVSLDSVLTVQPQVQIVPTVEKMKDKTFPIFSIVKGMTLVLVDLTEAPEVLTDLRAAVAPETELDEKWQPSFVGALYYKRLQAMEQPGEVTIHSIQARMITQSFEDPGTGSACCALACYLALHDDTNDKQVIKTDEDLAEKVSKVKLEKKVQKHVYAIQQGIEMGRACTIAVEVDVKTEDNGDISIAGVTLSGRANFFSEGRLLGP